MIDRIKQERDLMIQEVYPANIEGSEDFNSANQ